jgi:hypothetical protein
MRDPATSSYSCCGLKDPTILQQTAGWQLFKIGDRFMGGNTLFTVRSFCNSGVKFLAGKTAIETIGGRMSALDQKAAVRTCAGSMSGPLLTADVTNA